MDSSFWTIYQRLAPAATVILFIYLSTVFKRPVLVWFCRITAAVLTVGFIASLILNPL